MSDRPGASAVLFAVLATVCVVLAGAAALAGEKPDSSEPGICFVRVWTVAPLEPATDGKSAKWGVWLRTAPSVPAGLTTGVVSLVGDAERYDIPLTNFYTPSTATDDPLPARATPLVVQFPKPAKIVLAYVASLGGPNPGPCYHYSTFASGPKSEKATGVSTATLDFARSISAVDAPAPVPDPPLPNCVDDDKREYPKPKDVVMPKPHTNITAVGDLITLVRIDLTDEGVLASASIFKSSGDDKFDKTMLLGAVASKYTGGQFRCRPAGGTYIFRGEMDNVYTQ